MSKVNGALSAPASEQSAQPESKVARRRRRYLIDTKFQLRYVAVAFSAIILLAVLVEATLVYAGTVSPIEGRYSLILSLKWGAVGFVVVVAIVLLATLINVRATHRVAGPMYRFKESTKTVGNGDLTHLVKIRRTDELQDYAEMFNGMTAALRDRLEIAKQRADELEDTLAYAARLSDACTVETELRDEIARARDVSRRLATELAFFKTGDGSSDESSKEGGDGRC